MDKDEIYTPEPLMRFDPQPEDERGIIQLVRFDCRNLLTKLKVFTGGV